jgi:predicted metal-dependent HD superfamily phosphohydrolase
MTAIGGAWREGFAMPGVREPKGWGAAIGYPGVAWKTGPSAIDVWVFESRNLSAHWDALDAFEGEEYVRLYVPLTRAGAASEIAFTYALREPSAKVIADLLGAELLLARWRNLAGEEADDLGEALIRAWSEPQRHYHDQGHLVWLLDEAERRASLIQDAAFVGYAIWFHDAVYQPGEPNNETLSADWARTSLAHDPTLAERVAQVIEMTKNHAEGKADGDAALFLDMDIAILGAPWATYRAYAAGIRAEYPHVVDAAFAAGRGAFLEKQLAHRRTFRTDLYENELGERARANMRWEREEMRRGRMVKA